MSLHRRLASLERRLPPAEPEGPEPEPVPLPLLAEFQAMPLEQQRYILLCWDPPPSGVTLPPPEEAKRMPTDDLKRLMDEMERPGREALLPYVGISAHTPSKGFFRVRQVRGSDAPCRCIGRASPSRHNSGSFAKNCSRLSRPGPLPRSPDPSAAKAD